MEVKQSYLDEKKNAFACLALNVQIHFSLYKPDAVEGISAPLLYCLWNDIQLLLPRLWLAAAGTHSTCSDTTHYWTSESAHRHPITMMKSDLNQESLWDASLVSVSPAEITAALYTERGDQVRCGAPAALHLLHNPSSWCIQGGFPGLREHAWGSCTLLWGVKTFYIWTV